MLVYCQVHKVIYFPSLHGTCTCIPDIFVWKRTAFYTPGHQSQTKIWIAWLSTLPSKWDTFTHWGRMTHIWFGNLTIIGSDNGLSPDRRQALIWANAGILLIGPWGTNVNEIVIGIQTFLFKKMHLKMSSAKWRPFCLGLNVLKGVMSVP